jgi:hypothetical protein
MHEGESARRIADYLTACRAKLKAEMQDKKA